jgi:hypothetical protein
MRGPQQGGHNFIDMTGERVGRLMVAEFSHIRNGYAWWVCECDCGDTKKISGKELRRGARPTLSCGCLRIEVAMATIAEVNRLRRDACIRALFGDGLYPQGKPRQEKQQ